MSAKIGILGRKLGMTRIFASDGTAIACTVIQAGPCPIIQVKDEAKDGYNAVQLAFDATKEHRLTKPEQGHLNKAGKGLFKTLREFRLDGPAEMAVGEDVTVGIFKVGEFVKITGQSIGKGYAGVMKRWNFAGASNTHGTEKTHRSGGSIGMHTFPGRVFKNKKMAGHMGAERVTRENLMILEVRPDDNVILVKGPVPGARNSLVMVRKQ